MEAPTLAPTAYPTYTPYLTYTPLPTSAPTQIPTRYLAIEIGEWCVQGSVALQLKQLEIDGDLVELKFEFWNKTDGQLMFKWKDKVNFSMTDNLGNNYRVAVSDMGEQQEIFNAGERQLLQERLNTVEFYTDYLYDRGVTDLYITVEYLSRIEKATFHIPINK